MGDTILGCFMNRDVVINGVMDAKSSNANNEMYDFDYY